MRVFVGEYSFCGVETEVLRDPKGIELRVSVNDILIHAAHLYDLRIRVVNEVVLKYLCVRYKVGCEMI